MKAIVVEDHGGPEVLQIQEVPDPTPGPGQVVVKLGAAGVNPFETLRRAGTPPYNVGPMPYTPGCDGAGEIVAVGEGTHWKGGDRVFTWSPKGSGTYAELMLCSQDDVYPLADNVTFEQGAAIGVPYATAHRALFGKANGKAGEFVFIHGATGGVGIAAIQLAKRAGLKIGGSAGDAAGEEFLESLGVRYTANHSQVDHMSDVLGMTCGAGCDIILEMAAHRNLGSDGGALAPGGRIVVIGSRGEVSVNPRDWMGREAVVYAMSLFNTPPDQIQEIFSDISAGLAEGQLSPIIGQEFALEDAAEAHQAILKSGARGKIILKI
ncbi:NADPH:quinone reductase [bacterium]|nr:MAG: NADPH:quinone reductase [bacterium]